MDQRLAALSVWGADDERWPPVPERGFAYMRLSERSEGHISNFERTLDGFLAGLPYERLLPAFRARSNIAPFEKPIVDIGF